MTACSNSQADVNISVPEGTDIDSLRVSYERENLIQLLKITEAGVNIRSSESFDASSVIAQSGNDEYYVLLSKGDVWNQINYNGTIAYVHESYSEISSMLASSAQAYIDGDVITSDETGDETVSDETGDETTSDETGDETASDETGDETTSDETGDDTTSDETGDDTSSEEEVSSEI